MLLSSIVALIFSSAVVSVSAQSCMRTYTVESGDVCDGISAAQNVSTYQLAVLNPSINAGCTNLMPGQVLCLGTPGDDCNTTYVVEPNDTCDEVAAAHKIDPSLLYHNNPQLDAKCDNMYIGEVLCVAPTGVAPPLPTGSLPATTIPTTALPANTDIPWCN
jgi:LysM repeat protein